MALKAIIESIEGLPEEIRKEYVERNGRYELQVEGMRTQGDIDRLQSALSKEREDHKKIRERVSILGDRNIDDVIVQLDRIPELEAAAAGKIDDEKINQIVDNRVRTKLAPIERERDTLRSQLGEKDKVIETFSVKERTRMIHDSVRSAATKAKILPEALDDALMLAERVFEVSEDGKVVAKENVGVTPGIDPALWFSDLQSRRPHWWGQTTGGGAGGNRGGGGAGANPWSAENWNMTEQGRIHRENPTRARQLAEAAGTTIGGQKPKAKR